MEALRYQVPVRASSAKCGKRPESIFPSGPTRASTGNSSITIMITGGFFAETVREPGVGAAAPAGVVVGQRGGPVGGGRGEDDG